MEDFAEASIADGVAHLAGGQLRHGPHPTVLAITALSSRPENRRGQDAIATARARPENVRACRAIAACRA